MDFYLMYAQGELELSKAKGEKEFFKALNKLLEGHNGLHPEDSNPKLTNIQRKYYKACKKATGETSIKRAMMRGYAEDPEGFPLVLRSDETGSARLYVNGKAIKGGAPESSDESLQKFKDWVNDRIALANHLKFDFETLRAQGKAIVELMTNDQDIDSKQAIEMFKESPGVAEIVDKIDASLKGLHA